ncbi:MAG: MATE family efflux transporter [Candidatus Paceibacterota bacterium]|jgi:putative MATE family efflux protein
MEKIEKRIKEGSIWKQFFKLSIPIAIANFLQAAYSITDAFWLGRLNSESLAAISISSSIIFLVISLGVGLFISGSVLISHHKGKEDQENINHISAQLIMLMVIVSLFLSILGYFISPFLVKMIGAEYLIPYGVLSFLQLFFVSTLFIFSFALYQALMRALGDVKTPVYIILSTVLLNFFIDPLFIFGFGFMPRLGTEGAALATIFCELINTLIAGYIILRGKSGIVLKKNNFKFDLKMVKKILRIGIPSSMEQFARSMGFVIITFLVARLGTTSVAAYGVGGEILGAIMVISMSFMMATSVMVGRSVGSGNYERVEFITKSVAKMSFLVITFLGFLSFVFAEGISRLFIPNDPAVIVESIQYLRIMSLFFGFLSLQQIFNGSFTGSGDTKTSMFLAIISLWVLRIPIAFVLSNTSLGFAGICWSFPIANIIAAILGYLVFAKGKWKERSLVHY